MVSLRIRLHYGILQLLFLTQTALADALTVTITAYPGFLNQRTCAEACFLNGGIDFPVGFRCPTNPLENSCYCREDLISSVANSISHCVSQICTGNSVNVQSATSIYFGYCSQNGYVMAAPTVSVGSNAGNSQAAKTIQEPSTATQTIIGTNNGNSGGGGGDSACGNGVTNVTGVNINCGSRSDGGLSSTDRRSLALGLWLGLGLPACFIAFLALCA